MMNRAQLKAKELRKHKKVAGELRMEGAKYALNVYRQAMQIVLGIGEKRLEKVDDKFNELLHRDEIIYEMKRRGEV